MRHGTKNGRRYGAPYGAQNGAPYGTGDGDRGHAEHPGHAAPGGTAAGDPEAAPATWARTLRAPWAAVCAAAAVVLGPAAVTASALDLANAAPPHSAVRADQTQAYLPSDTRRRASA